MRKQAFRGLSSTILMYNLSGYKSPPMVYLRSFKDQQEHSRAQQASFNLASYGFSSVPYTLRAKMQIAGEYLMLILHKSLPVESIVIWHWPSGMVNAVSPPPSMSLQRADQLRATSFFISTETLRA